jgi:hypothetical protein
MYTLEAPNKSEVKKKLRRRFPPPKTMDRDLAFALSRLPEGRKGRRIFHFARLFEIPRHTIKSVPVKSLPGKKFAI